MENIKYITWIDLKPDNVISLLAISRLNSLYNENDDEKEEWSSIFNLLSLALNDKTTTYEFPEDLIKYFPDTIDDLRTSWFDATCKNNPYKYVQTKAKNLIAKEQKTFAVHVYNTLCNEYGFSSEVANIILSKTGPVLATKAVDWVVSCGESLLEYYTDLEIYDILNVAANAHKIGHFGRSRHLKILEAFDLPNIGIYSAEAFRKITSVVEPIAANIYEKRSFEERNPSKQYIYRYSAESEYEDTTRRSNSYRRYTNPTRRTPKDSFSSSSYNNG